MDFDWSADVGFRSGVHSFERFVTRYDVSPRFPSFSEGGVTEGQR